MRARIAYINYTKKLRIYNILNLFCVVYIHVSSYPQNELVPAQFGAALVTLIKGLFIFC